MGNFREIVWSSFVIFPNNSRNFVFINEIFMSFSIKLLISNVIKTISMERFLRHVQCSFKIFWYFFLRWVDLFFHSSFPTLNFTMGLTDHQKFLLKSDGHCLKIDDLYIGIMSASLDSFWCYAYSPCPLYCHRCQFDVRSASSS